MSSNLQCRKQKYKKYFWDHSTWFQVEIDSHVAAERRVKLELFKRYNYTSRSEHTTGIPLCDIRAILKECKQINFRANENDPQDLANRLRKVTRILDKDKSLKRVIINCIQEEYGVELDMSDEKLDRIEFSNANAVTSFLDTQDNKAIVYSNNKLNECPIRRHINELKREKIEKQVKYSTLTDADAMEMLSYFRKHGADKSFLDEKFIQVYDTVIEIFRFFPGEMDVNLYTELLTNGTFEKVKTIHKRWLHRDDVTKRTMNIINMILKEFKLDSIYDRSSFDVDYEKPVSIGLQRFLCDESEFILSKHVLNRQAYTYTMLYNKYQFVTDEFINMKQEYFKGGDVCFGDVYGGKRTRFPCLGARNLLKKILNRVLYIDISGGKVKMEEVRGKSNDETGDIIKDVGQEEKTEKVQRNRRSKRRERLKFDKFEAYMRILLMKLRNDGEFESSKTKQRKIGEMVEFLGDKYDPYQTPSNYTGCMFKKRKRDDNDEKGVEGLRSINHVKICKLRDSIETAEQRRKCHLSNTFLKKGETMCDRKEKMNGSRGGFEISRRFDMMDVEEKC